MPNEIGHFDYDHLFAGGVQRVVVQPVTLKSGQSYVRGSVLALGSDGLAVLVDSASADESAKKPYAILADNVDASSGNVQAAAYMTGEFNQDALVFGGKDTHETHKQQLRNIGIFLNSVQKA